jgi:hypothetical protein
MTVQMPLQFFEATYSGSRCGFSSRGVEGDRDGASPASGGGIGVWEKGAGVAGGVAALSREKSSLPKRTSGAGLGRADANDAEMRCEPPFVSGLDEKRRALLQLDEVSDWT